jgi:hypothetical protein
LKNNCESIGTGTSLFEHTNEEKKPSRNNFKAIGKGTSFHGHAYLK